MQKLLCAWMRQHQAEAGSGAKADIAITTARKFDKKSFSAKTFAHIDSISTRIPESVKSIGELFANMQPIIVLKNLDGVNPITAADKNKIAETVFANVPAYQAICKKIAARREALANPGGVLGEDPDVTPEQIAAVAADAIIDQNTNVENGALMFTFTQRASYSAADQDVTLSPEQWGTMIALLFKYIYEQPDICELMVAMPE